MEIALAIQRAKLQKEKQTQKRKVRKMHEELIEPTDENVMNVVQGILDVGVKSFSYDSPGAGMIRTASELMKKLLDERRELLRQRASTFSWRNCDRYKTADQAMDAYAKATTGKPEWGSFAHWAFAPASAPEPAHDTGKENAVLVFPLRNMDRYMTAEEATHAWNRVCSDEWKKGNTSIDWLYSEWRH